MPWLCPVSRATSELRFRPTWRCRREAEPHHEGSTSRTGGPFGLAGMVTLVLACKVPGSTMAQGTSTDERHGSSGLGTSTNIAEGSAATSGDTGEPSETAPGLDPESSSEVTTRTPSEDASTATTDPAEAESGSQTTGSIPTSSDDGTVASTGPVEPADPFVSSSYQRPRPLGSTAANAGYWEYLPPESGNAPRPLLVALHGIGENAEGTAETLPDVLVNGPARLIARDEWPLERPFIVLSPQFDGASCPDARWVNEFIEYAVANYEIDLARVYLTGLSCGAYGVWNYLGTYVDARVAAAVPIAGNGAGAWNQRSCDLGRVPIWAFHGDLDEQVAATGTTDPVEHLQGCDPEPVDLRMTIYLGVGHDSWSRTYDLSAGHDIYTWMLEHRKAE